MALLEVLQSPDPRLRKIAKPVEKFDLELARFIEDLAETMYFESGIGIASIQVGVPLRLFLIDLEDGRALKVFINPTVTIETTERCDSEEGCLSVKKSEWKGTVRRATKVSVTAQDVKGTPFTLQADGLLAIALQHENDHLNGILFIDKRKT